MYLQWGGKMRLLFGSADCSVLGFVCAATTASSGAQALSTLQAGQKQFHVALVEVSTCRVPLPQPPYLRCSSCRVCTERGRSKFQLLDSNSSVGAGILLPGFEVAGLRCCIWERIELCRVLWLLLAVLRTSCNGIAALHKLRMCT